MLNKVKSVYGGKTIILITVAIFFNLNLFSQTNQEWLQRYNGPNSSGDRANDMTRDAAGNIYVTGTSEYGYLTIKYNSSGVLEWAARYQGNYYIYNDAFAVTADNSGNVYVTGENGASGGAHADIVTVKYNSSGVQVWAVRTTGSGVNNDVGRSIAVDASGNIYVVGSVVTTGTGSDITTIKYSQDGNIQWMIPYNRQGSSGDMGKELVLDAAGNIYVSGSTNIPNTASGTDITTIKYNPAGTEQWVMHYNPNGLADSPNSITLDTQGNVIVAGSSTGTGPSLGDYITLKYDPITGIQQWASRYNYQNHNDAVNDVTTDASGNVYVTGFSISTLYGDDYATIKYNSSGVQQWVQRYTSPGNDRDEAFAVAVDGFGSVYITGQAAISTSDYLTIKYNSSGVQLWSAVYNNGSTDGAADMELDANNNLFVTGFSIGTGTSYDYATVKYSQVTGIEPVSNEIPNEFSLQQNYPNPFNPSTNIKFSIPKNSNVKISVFSSAGKEIETLVNSELNAGKYNADWNASIYSSGIYFYRITADGFTETKKMILVK